VPLEFLSMSDHKVYTQAGVEFMGLTSRGTSEFNTLTNIKKIHRRSGQVCKLIHVWIRERDAENNAKTLARCWTGMSGKFFHELISVEVNPGWRAGGDPPLLQEYPAEESPTKLKRFRITLDICINGYGAQVLSDDCGRDYGMISALEELSPMQNAKEAAHRVVDCIIQDRIRNWRAESFDPGI